MTDGREGREGPPEPGERERAGWRRPDASMSLLSDLMAGRAADPGYAAAAARRAAAGEAGARRGPLARAGVPLALVLTGLLIVAAGAEVRRSEPVAAERRSRLIEEIRLRTAHSDALQRRLDTGSSCRS
ncbi:hypothetical protein [Spirillospora sp. NPDC029432]|uniref:hypothetical protein n=1 Tax=Spirillospora sp. NPDC029432 TaxID=3154599 RepID=UPI00345273BC